MKSLKLSFAVIVLFLLFSMPACSQSPDVKISIKGDNKFPNISIVNPFGKNVTIQPISSTIGSIGFERDGKINWIKGKPFIKVGH